MYLLDTDILIDVQRGYLPSIVWFSSLTEIPSIPGFVIMELIQGTGNSQQLRNVLKLVAPFPIILPNETDFAHALSDFTAYHLSHNLGLIDALIAACALGQDAILCTFNVKHYQAIPGLQITQPYSRS